MLNLHINKINHHQKLLVNFWVNQADMTFLRFSILLILG